MFFYDAYRVFALKVAGKHFDFAHWKRKIIQVSSHDLMLLWKSSGTCTTEGIWRFHRFSCKVEAVLKPGKKQ